MIIGTSGHIDHGKTSLVRAITGIDADRLKEEKARGITIDLGFAYWPQPDGTSIGFVDVPGHEGYIHNMLAGITGVSALMLVVAANEGVKPQTLEHLLIADLLHLDQAVVALTKADLVDDDLLHQRMQELRDLLAPTSLREAAILPVSSVTGMGLEELKSALTRLRQGEAQAAERPFRLSVDRAFTLQGTGTVITGAVRSGTIALDNRFVLSPHGKDVRVRGLHAQNRRAETATQRQRVAINLAGIAPDEISRGDVLLGPAFHRPTQRLDATVRLASDQAKPLSAWTAVHLHAGSGFWPARLVPLSANSLSPGDAQLAQIVLDRPAAILGGDRFILRDSAGRRTIGGGQVLDIRAPERNRRKPERLKALGLLAKFGAIDALPELLQLPPFAVAADNFATDHALALSDLNAVIARDNLLGLPSDEQRFLFSPPIILTLSRRIRDRLAEHHAKQPDQAGMTAERLRLALPERLLPEAFGALTAHLVRRREIAATGSWFRLPDHIPRLSAEHEMLWAMVLPLLSGDNRFKPPRVNELAEQFRKREDTIRGLMKRLARRGDVDEVAEDHFLLRTAVADLLSAARNTQAGSPESWFNAAAFRDQIGIGRKMAILILEFFDRHGVTIRKGDLRRLDPRKIGVFSDGSKVPQQPLKE